MGEHVLENEQFQYQILLSICSGLGHYAESEDPAVLSASPLDRPYKLGAESIECLRDLKQLLRHDFNSSEKSIHEKLGTWNIVKNHLLPMFLQFGVGGFVQVPTVAVTSALPSPDPTASTTTSMPSAAGTDMAETAALHPVPSEPVTCMPPCPTRTVYIMTGRNKTIAKLILELLVAMTWPYDTDAQPDAPPPSNHALLDYVLAYKEVLASPLFMQHFLDVLMHALSQNSRKQESREYAETIIQLSIFLLRNLLVIPDVEFQGKSIQTRLIAVLYETKVMELLHSMCSEMVDGRYAEWCLLLLEVYVALWFARDPLDLTLGMDTDTMRASHISLLFSLAHSPALPCFSWHAHWPLFLWLWACVD